MAKWMLHMVAFIIYVTNGPIEDYVRSDHLDSRNFGWNITSVALNINTL